MYDANEKFKMNLRKTRIFLLSAFVIMGLMLQGCAALRIFSREPKCEVRKEPYPVVYAAVPPKIDGKLDDAIWQQAVALSTFYRYAESGQRTHIGTAYLAWDRDNLYFCMDIKDKDLYVTEKENNEILCRADVAELFIKPCDDRLDFYEFEFNVWNALWDIHYIGRGGGGASRFTEHFNSGAIVRATHAGTINDWNDVDEGWTVEVAIPLKAFARAVPEGPQPGDLWKFNVSGYDFSCYREKGLLFTMCDGNFRGFAEYELYPSMQFMINKKGEKKK
ncbi:MAG: carbohydrate-binding family 9-like protein [bacterium]|nr:carbohydrate-binding family 9-like protein [bacterium]